VIKETFVVVLRLKRLDLGLNEGIDFSQRVEGLLRYGEVHRRTVRPASPSGFTEVCIPISTLWNKEFGVVGPIAIDIQDFVQTNTVGNIWSENISIFAFGVRNRK